MAERALDNYDDTHRICQYFSFKDGSRAPANPITAVPKLNFQLEKANLKPCIENFLISRTKMFLLSRFALSLAKLIR
jgi:hypothetical protein